LPYARAASIRKGLPRYTDGLRDVRSPDDLPAAARRYISSVEKWVGVPVSLLSVGPRRAETLVFDNPFRAKKQSAVSSQHSARRRRPAALSRGSKGRALWNRRPA